MIKNIKHLQWLPDTKADLRIFLILSMASESDIRSISSKTTCFSWVTSTFSSSINSFKRSGVATRISQPFVIAVSWSSDFFLALKIVATDKSLTIDSKSLEICLTSK